MMRKLALLALLAAAPLFATSHTYWRINITRSGLPAVGQLVFLDGGGSTISTSGGTASASSTFSGQPASMAFNGATDCSTFWLANAASPQWLKMQFASPVAVDHISITAGCNGGRGPQDFSLQWSDDNSSWTSVNEWDGANWPSTTTTAFTSSNATPVSLGVAWRIFVTSQASGNVTLQNVALFDKSAVSISLANYAWEVSGSFSDGFAASASLGSGTRWDAGSVAPAWIGFKFPTVQQLGSFQIGNAGGSAPTPISVQYSLDNSTWTTANTYSPTWSGVQTKTFTVTGGPGGFVPGVGAFLVGP